MAFNNLYVDKIDLILMGVSAICESDLVSSIAIAILAIKWSAEARRRCSPRAYQAARNYWLNRNPPREGVSEPHRSLRDLYTSADINNAFLQIETLSYHRPRNSNNLSLPVSYRNIQ